MAAEFGFEFNAVMAIEPLGFLEFLQLEANARAWRLLTREECRRRPAFWASSRVTLRENTERPETVDVGSNILAEMSAIKILKATRQMLLQGNGWMNPFGYGRASNFILDAVPSS